MEDRTKRYKVGIQSPLVGRDAIPDGLSGFLPGEPQGRLIIQAGLSRGAKCKSKTARRGTRPHTAYSESARIKTRPSRPESKDFQRPHARGHWGVASGMHAADAWTTTLAARLSCPLRDVRPCGFAARPFGRCALVLALMLIVITSANMPVTGICRVFSVQRGPGNVEESAQWAGICVWLTAKAHDLRQTRMLWGRRVRSTVIPRIST